jgi:hypothetical protein
MSEDYKLKEHGSIPRPSGPVMVCIVDGYGENEYTDKFNAVAQAETPCFDKLRQNAARFRYRYHALDVRVRGRVCQVIALVLCVHVAGMLYTHLHMIRARIARVRDIC